jgi:hypothetical protein
MLPLVFIPITVTTACSNHGHDVPMTMHTPPPAPAESRNTRKERPHEAETVTISGTTWVNERRTPFRAHTRSGIVVCHDIHSIYNAPKQGSVADNADVDATATTSQDGWLRPCTTNTVSHLLTICKKRGHHLALQSYHGNSPSRKLCFLMLSRPPSRRCLPT